MKEHIISRLNSVKESLSVINKLNDDYNYGRLNYYWDVMYFIDWVKVNEPTDYEVYDLEETYYTIDEFGETYLDVFKITKSGYAYRLEDGILAIGEPLDQMILELYDYVIALQENEIDIVKNSTDTYSMSLKDLMAEITALRVDVKDVSTALNKPAADTTASAKAIVMEVLNPVKPQKKLTQKERYDDEIANKMAERKLKMIQNAAKRGK